jgi:hypothetical protein
MRLDRIDQMSEVMRAMFDKEYQAISGLLVEETSLRKKLRQLEIQISQNRKLCSKDTRIQSVGAQFLWQGWTTRTHRQLNTELAQVMARKLVAMDRVRIAFGRQQAIEMMQVSERRLLKKRQSLRQSQVLLSLGVPSRMIT